MQKSFELVQKKISRVMARSLFVIFSFDCKMSTYLVAPDSMSESKSGPNSSKVAFFKVPIVFCFGKRVGVARERLDDGLFKDVLSPA